MSESKPRSRKLRRVFVWFVSVLVVLALVLTAFGVYSARRSFPQLGGSLTVAGLDDAVQVLARRPKRATNLRLHSTRPVLCPGVYPRPGAFLADGLLAPHRLRNALGDVRERGGQDRCLPSHHGLGGHREAGVG